MKYKDLTNQRFGRLIAKRRGENDKTGHTRWFCDCDCGTKDVLVYKDALLDGRQVSCGCFSKEQKSKTFSELNRKYNTYDLSGDYGIGYTLKGEEKSSVELLENNTLFLSKNGGKYGYVDKKGNVVVDYIYDDATEQNEYGFAAVKKNGLWGSIDKEGKIIIEPKYNLENNLKIDFIGKWHLGEDLNMNYYCEK